MSSGQRSASEGRRQRKIKALTGPRTPAASSLYPSPYLYPSAASLFPQGSRSPVFLTFPFGAPVFQEYKGVRNPTPKIEIRLLNRASRFLAPRALASTKSG